MKKYILLFIAICLIINCHAQETVKKKNRLLPSVTEEYMVLKDADSVKQGLYQALYKRKIALASGLYNQNKRTGVWHFYDTDYNLVENYDYDNKKLEYEEPMDSATNTHIVYAFDDKFGKNDHVTRPVKIGGRCYGYIPYLQLYQLPSWLYGINTAEYIGIVELLISPGGRLADIKIHIKSVIDEHITSFSPELVNEENREFIPATLNNEPIISRIFVKCRLTDQGQLDLDF